MTNLNVPHHLIEDSRERSRALREGREPEPTKPATTDDLIRTMYAAKRDKDAKARELLNRGRKQWDSHDGHDSTIGGTSVGMPE